jgi:4-amino-4-deoxy-L-arabinose transferase-like glycosyltransferase
VHSPRLTSGRGGLAWICAGAIACGIAIPLEPSLLEEGILLHIAQRLARGEHLYRDVLAFTGPFPFELLAALFRVFGEGVWVGRIAIALLHGVSTGIVYVLARRAGTGAFAHAAAAVFASAPLLLFPLYSLFYYTTLALHLSVIAAYAALRGLDSNRWALLAGAAVACTALSKQSVGVLLAVTLGAALLSQLPHGRRRAGGSAYAVGGFGVAVVTLVAFAAAGGLGNLIHATIVLPMTLGESYQSPYVNFWPIGAFSPEVQHNARFYLPYFYTLLNPQLGHSSVGMVALTQLLYALPLLAIAAPFAARLRRSAHAAESVDDSASWIHLALLVAWSANLFPRTDWGHLAHVLPFALVQMLISATARAGSAAPGQTRSRAAVMGVVVLIAGAGVAGVVLYLQSTTPSYGPRLPLRPVSRAAKSPAVPRTIEFLRSRLEPGEAIFVARAEPLLYFATDAPNPTRFPGIVPGWREEQERSILESLSGVRYVVMSDVDQPSMTYYRDELPAVQAHLERHYRVPPALARGPLQWLTVLERHGDRGETAIDLIERAPGARAFEREGAGREVPVPILAQRMATQYNRRPLVFALGARGGGIDFDLEIPARAVFQGAVGLRRVRDPEARFGHPPTSRLRVSLRREGSGEVFALLGEERAMEVDRPGTRWTELEVDLREYAGERVTLRLELESRKPVSEGSLGWWGSPRIAIRTDLDGDG